MSTLLSSDSLADNEHNSGANSIPLYDIRISLQPQDEGDNTYSVGRYTFTYKNSSVQLTPERIQSLSGEQVNKVFSDYIGIDITRKDLTAEEKLKITRGMDELRNVSENQPRWVDKIKSAVVPFLFAGQVAQATVPPLQSVQTPSHVERIMNGNKNTSELDAIRVKQQIAGLSQFRTKIGTSDLYGALEYSQRGVLLKGGIVSSIGNDGAVSVDIKIGKEEQEILAQVGMQVAQGAVLKASFAHLRQMMEFTFPSGSESQMMNQDTFGVSLRIKGRDFVKFLEVSGYHSVAKSHDFGSREYTVDSATLYQLWNMQNRVAGGTTSGIEGKVELLISEKGNIRLNLTGGVTRTQYDTLLPTPSTTNPVAEIGLKFDITPSLHAEIKSRHTKNLSDRHTVSIENDDGVKFEVYQDKPVGGKSSTGVLLGINIPLDSHFRMVQKNTKKSSQVESTTMSPAELRRFTTDRAPYIPYSVNARVDSTVLPELLVQIDKTMLPTGTTIDNFTGDLLIKLPDSLEKLGTVTNITTGMDIKGVFSLEGNTLRFNSKSILSSLKSGVANIIEAETTNYFITLTIEKGSVKITNLRIQRKFDDAPTVANPPTIEKLSYTSFEAVVHIEDADGVRNLACQLQTPEGVNIGNPQLPVNGRCTFPGLTPDKTYKIVTTGETRQRDMRGSEIWVAQSRETLIKTPLGVDSPTTIVLGISNLTTSSVLAACNIIDLDGATGTCTLSGGPGATSWAIGADKSLTELSDGITYTLTVDGIKKVKNANNTLTDVVVHQVVTFTTIESSDTTPDAFTFTSQTGSQRNTTVDSASVNITGINQPTSVSVTNGLVSINGGAFVTSGTISNGQSLVTRVTTSDSYNTPTTATVTVGGVNSTFTATTLANGTPTLPAVSDVNVIVGTAGSVVLPVGSDTAGDTLTYSLGTLPTGFSFNATTRTLSWTGTTAPATTNVSYTVTDQGGLSSTPQNVKIVVTSAPDTTPDAFTFTSQTGSQRNTTVDSASVNITGINQPTSVSVTNGLVSINGGAFVTSGTISNGQSLVTRVTTSDSYNTPTTATVTVGGVNSTFTATTLANGTPTLPAVSDVNVIVGTAGSVVLPVGSDTAGDTLTYSLGTLPTGFSFNATTRTLSWTGTTAPATTNVSYTVTDQGGLSSTPQNVKIVVTSAPDTTPDAFTFTSQTGSQRNTTVDSVSVNITGINQPTSVSVTNGLVSINGGAFVTSGTISNGQSLVTRVTTSDSYNTPTTATVTVGGVNSTFTATTLANGTPTLPAVSDVNVIVGTAGSVVLPVGSDTAGDTLTYSLGTLPTGFSFNATTRTLSWTGTTAPATTNVSYTVTDQGGLSSTPQNVKIVVTSAPDTTPDAFTFTSQTGSQRNTTVDSASVNITGINQPTSVSVTNGLVSINGGAFVTSGTISNGQSLVTRVTTSDSYNTPTTATVTVGGVNSTFTATTLANGTPTLPAVSDVNVIVGTAGSVVLPVGSDTAGDTLTYSLGTLPTGFSFNATTRTLSWTGTTAPATTNVSYTVTDQGGLSSTPQNVKIVVTSAPDTTPDAFTFTSQTGSQRNTTVDSASVNITGINQPTSVSVTNGLVSINGGAFVTSGTISNGQSLVTRVTTSDSYNTPTTATVTVGGVNSTFTATTLANGTPTLPAVSDVNVIVGTAGSVVLPVGSDTAGDTLTYSLGTLPTGFSFNATTRTLSWTGTTAPATTNVSYTVTDQGGLSSTPQNVKIVVNAPANTTDPTVSYNVDLNAELQSEGVYRYPTSVSNFTLSSLSANDPEGIGSYTIISSLFGTLANGSGSLPSTVTTGSSVGKFLQTETITITVSDVGTPTRTTTKTITIVYDI